MSKGIATTITIKMDDVLPEGFYNIHQVIQEAFASRGFYIIKDDITVEVSKEDARRVKRAIGA